MSLCKTVLASAFRRTASRKAGVISDYNTNHAYVHNPYPETRRNPKLQCVSNPVSNYMGAAPRHHDGLLVHRVKKSTNMSCVEENGSVEDIKRDYNHVLERVYALADTHEGGHMLSSTHKTTKH